MIGKLEALLGAGLGTALGTAAPACQRREQTLDRLAAFDPQEPLVSCAFTIRDRATAWRMVIALPQALASWLVAEEPRRPSASVRGATDPLSGPMGDLPLTLRAVLVDMRMPVSALAALVPGQVIPVSVARSVPLAVGGKIVAAGTIGAQDDRVAVQVTQLFTKDRS